MKTNRLFYFLTAVLFFSVLLAGCEKNTEGELSFYDVELPGSSPVEIDEVKCFLSSTNEEIANAAYDPQGFTLRLPAVLPESSLSKINETLSDAIISDPQAKWQPTRLECYKNGEFLWIRLLNESNVIYVYADRSVTIDGQFSEDTVLDIGSFIKSPITLNYNCDGVVLKKGWNLVGWEMFMQSNSIEFRYYLPDDQNGSVSWYYSYPQFDSSSDDSWPSKWIIGR